MPVVVADWLADLLRSAGPAVVASFAVTGAGDEFEDGISVEGDGEGQGRARARRRVSVDPHVPRLPISPSDSQGYPPSGRISPMSADRTTPNQG